MFKKSLVGKINLLTTGLMIFAVIIFSGVFIYSEYVTLKAATIRNAETFSVFAIPAIYKDYTQLYTHPVEKDFLEFRTRIERILERNRDIKRIRMVGINGKILFDSEEFIEGKYSGPDRIMANQEILAAVREGSTGFHESDAAEGDTSLHFIAPADTEGIHILSMVFSVAYDSLQNRLTQLYWEVLFTTLPLIGIGLLIPSRIISNMIQPLIRLKEAAMQMGSGNFDVQIPVTSEDEIGALAARFNEMSKGIKSSQSQIREYNQRLEKDVEERTKQLKDKVDEMQRMQSMLVGRELKMIELKAENEKLRQQLGMPSGMETPPAAAEPAPAAPTTEEKK